MPALPLLDCTFSNSRYLPAFCSTYSHHNVRRVKSEDPKRRLADEQIYYLSIQSAPEKNAENLMHRHLQPFHQNSQKFDWWQKNGQILNIWSVVNALQCCYMQRCFGIRVVIHAVSVHVCDYTKNNFYNWVRHKIPSTSNREFADEFFSAKYSQKNILPPLICFNMSVCCWILLVSRTLFLPINASLGVSPNLWQL